MIYDDVLPATSIAKHRSSTAARTNFAFSIAKVTSMRLIVSTKQLWLKTCQYLYKMLSVGRFFFDFLRVGERHAQLHFIMKHLNVFLSNFSFSSSTVFVQRYGKKTFDWLSILKRERKKIEEKCPVIDLKREKERCNNVFFVDHKRKQFQRELFLPKYWRHKWTATTSAFEIFYETMSLVFLPFDMFIY